MAAAATKLRFDDLSLEGASRAGDETWLRVHPPGLAFDAGRGAPPLTGARDLFLTHGHLDHALGIPFVLSQRALHGLGETRLFCPATTAEPLRELIEAASRLETVRYSYRLVPLGPGERVRVGRDLAVEAFATRHVVPALGYHLVRRRRRLSAALRGLPPERVAELARRGQEVEEEREEIWLSYCGDTTAELLDRLPVLYDSRVLVLECTFLDPRSRARALQFGHVHLDDLLERADRFRNRAVVLHHLSRRHSWDELRAELDRRLGPLARRFHLLGAPGGGVG